MATGRGLVAVNRWAFGELSEPVGTETLSEVLAAEAPTPAQSHLRRLCAGCHLGTRADNRDDAVHIGGSGCGACHSTRRAQPGDPHPRIDPVPPDDRCLGCHSRSARISLSYQGLAEVSGPGEAGCADPVALHDGRAGCRAPADVHFEAGIACVDCHVHTELMGDGTAYARERDALDVTCATCHGPAEPRTWADVADPVTADILRMRGQSRDPGEPARLGTKGTPVWNLRGDGQGGFVLLPKAGGPAWPVKPTPADRAHALPGHERLDCQSCHAAWAPTCPTCHTEYDPTGEQWDFGASAVAKGRWVETNEGMGIGAPSLGVRSDGSIGPAVPGMIAHIDATAAGGPARDLRLFSIFDPHTTGRRARSCASCHTDPGAIGLGAGHLALDGDSPRFDPAHPDPSGSPLPLDAWTTLLPSSPGASTRTGGRSLDAREQWRVLRVGRCLGCHTETRDPIWESLDRAVLRLARGDSRCPSTAPPWVLDPPP
jgi:hypothetical protein